MIQSDSALRFRQYASSPDGYFPIGEPAAPVSLAFASSAPSSSASTGVFATDELKEINLSAEDLGILNSSGVEIISVKENNQKRVVESIENGTESVTTFDKEKNIITMEIQGKEPIVVDLNAIESDPPISTLSTVGENTFSNYEYDINLSSQPYQWEIRRPAPPDAGVSMYFKKVTETSSNRSTLDSFRTEVNRINQLEGDIIISASVTVLATIVSTIATAISTGVGAGALLVALGLGGNTLHLANQLSTACSNAEYYYFRA